MSADSKSVTSATASEDERFIQIPHAAPGQEYKSPKNHRQPLIDSFYQLFVTLLCLSLPLAPAFIFFMILAYSKAVQYGLLWLWITMIVIIEPIALLVAWGIWREALGRAGVSYPRLSHR